MAIDKPATLHDRDAEWAALARFATDARPGPTLGVVYGRRRQGKTYLLDALTRTGRRHAPRRRPGRGSTRAG